MVVYPAGYGNGGNDKAGMRGLQLKVINLTQKTFFLRSATNDLSNLGNFCVSNILFRRKEERGLRPKGEPLLPILTLPARTMAKLLEKSNLCFTQILGKKALLIYSTPRVINLFFLTNDTLVTIKV